MRLLLVDDNEDLLRGLSRQLTALGCAVHTAANGEDAVTALHRLAFDAMVLDLRMDGMDGWEVLRRARDLRPKPVIMIMSGYLDVSETVRAMREGAADAIAKPASPEEILNRIREQLELDPTYNDRGPERILGETEAMRSIREETARVARFPELSVMIRGETGTGKELVARAIHEQTEPNAPMIAVNVAAVPAELFESELFGHQAGSFTGARGPRVGLLEAAGAGTVFLDEIGELDPALQPKLLRVLETREFRPIGSNKPVRLEARIISATNRPLRRETETFRADLYFRLAGFLIRTPPLRERLDDIPLLSRHLLQAFARRHPDCPTEIGDEAIARLQQHDWPGNVRELRSVIEQAAVNCTNGELSPAQVVEALSGRSTLPPPSPSERVLEGVNGKTMPLRDLERNIILDTYRANNENISQTARELGIPRSTLKDKLRRYGMR
ncbi:MAG: sigma-54 dependent transcriptional regulator [Myxococcota bacterium]